MAKFPVLALVALVAFQACSARVLLKEGPDDVKTVAEAVAALVAGAAEEVIGAVYMGHVIFTNNVQDVSSAIVFQSFDPEMYGDPEVVAQKALADIDTELAARSQRFSDLIEAGNAQVAATIARAAAAVQDDAAATALLSTIQQTYAQATAAVLNEANDFAENAADEARDEIDARPDTDAVAILTKLRDMYLTSARTIHRTVSKADKAVQDAIAKA